MSHFTSRGGKALIRLGIISTIIAVATTGLSLYFYHASGDIYIDRSRPGFLPEKHESEQFDNNSSYHFSEDGDISSQQIEEYLENLSQKIASLTSHLVFPTSLIHGLYKTNLLAPSYPLDFFILSNIRLYKIYNLF